MPAPTSSDPPTIPQSTSVAVDAVHFRQLCPWLRMFDLFRIAVDLQKLLLAVAALLLLWGGNWCILKLPFATPQAIHLQSKVFTFGPANPAQLSPARQAAAFGEPFGADWRSWTRVLSPLDTVVRPVQILFRGEASWSQLALSWTQLLWALVVWAVFAGAITRIAAVQIGTDRNTGLMDALKFSVRRFLSYFSTPLIPLSGIGVLWGLCLLAGLVGRIPTAGPWIVGACWGIVLLLGFLMALTLVGLAVGWPLMFATISVEGSDAPDGLTRSYGYVFAKPVYYVLLVAIAVLSGAVATYLVSHLAGFAAYMADWGVTWGMGSNKILQNKLAAGWMSVLEIFVVAFAHSYFWSAATMIYFLLRRSVDANPFNEVYLEEDPSDELLPWVDEDQQSPTETPTLTPLTPPDSEATGDANPPS
ncbi:hypothetical protein Pan258_33370 [Symmachiella dynata]|uniref:hypothetical protein n=1 Tax=Symmachiella dynata TaxID=2527995 RepID=UPI001189DC12|nr:hypothetical protein [Symmachiella dynata]QDT49290.1 hypothetical protein Pan258_33370 [Symmachiella dynata]